MESTKKIYYEGENQENLKVKYYTNYIYRTKRKETLIINCA